MNFLSAGVAQLIERCLAKAKVAGLNPVSRSIFAQAKILYFPLSIFAQKASAKGQSFAAQKRKSKLKSQK